MNSFNNIENLPKEYKDTIKSITNEAIKIFKNNLINITLGGSAGKNDIIIGWSDLDLYVVVENYIAESIVEFSKVISKESLHIGVTYYTLVEVLNNRIDNKTKIMIYEKYYLNFNPTLYGKDVYIKNTYEDVVMNDYNYLPCILHEFRRIFINGILSKKSIDKKYIKKLLVLIKCYLNSNHIFEYGYASVINKFLVIYNKKNKLHDEYKFDIINVINNLELYQDHLIEFSKKAIAFIVSEMEEKSMDKRISARGIIISNNSVYAMFRRRIKDDGTIKEYYVIPGGGIEPNETLEENVIREMKEEFSVDVKILKYLGKDEGEDSIANFFSCEIISGEPKLGGEELERCCESNYYEIRLVPLSELDNIDIMSKEFIMAAAEK